MTAEQEAAAVYSEEQIQTLDWKEHIRRRPGMYIGKLGDGSQPDDGIYILIKEVLDNSLDEYTISISCSVSARRLSFFLASGSELFFKL